MEGIGAVILAGGKSSRMGENKAFLRLEKGTFLERLLSQLAGFDEVLLSVDNKNRYAESHLWRTSLPGRTPPKLVEDKFSQIGPMGGIYSALTVCEAPWLLVVSCDMPLFSDGLAEYMCGFAADGYEACIVMTREDRVQPLCALYAKSAAFVLRKQIAEGNYRIMDALAQMRVKRIPLRHSVYADDRVQNINTPQEFARLRRQLEGPRIVAVSGLKNAGKTTLLVGLVSRLCRSGLRVAVVKHDGHDFVPDVPGTDSFRFREAGAYATAVYSPHRYMMTAEQSGWEQGNMAEMFPDADVILLEGGKSSPYPKIEVVRKAITDGEMSAHSVCEAGTLLAVCSDFGFTVPGVPALSLDNHDEIAQVLLTFLQKETDPCKTAMEEKSITREFQ